MALSTSSIQWGWSTGTFTDPGITGYRLYTGTPTVPDYQELPAGTTFFIDSGLGANKMITRWLAVSSGAELGSDSPHFEKYTYALPPASFLLSTVTATSAYLEWAWSTATAYAIEGSTNNGASYYRIRDSFVPWQTVELISNKAYRIRMGALNGDNELTPGQFSTEKTTTTPPLNPSFEPAVAVSSYSIQWRWSTGTFTGTGITGYRLYRSTSTDDAVIPTDGLDGVIVADLADITLSSWTETFTDSGTVASANSRHTRWLKAYGILESTGMPLYQKYTYAIAPATCSASYLDPAPYTVFHVLESSLDSLMWNTGLAPAPGRNGIASNYVVEYSTVGDFAVPLGTVTAAAPPASVNGLTPNTKYDVRLGVVNGDNEQTPDDPENPYAYSDYFKFMTKPGPPSGFTARPKTDTILTFTWSTSTYANPEYITGYTIAKSTFNESLQKSILVPVAFMPGVSSSEYSLDYLLTNSTHTRYIWAHQADPDCGLPPHFWCYDSGASDNISVESNVSAEGATFATPPNDVSFSTVGARNLWVWWNEPEVPATKYRVERSTTLGSQGPWVFISSVTGANFQDTGLTPLTTYSYRIGAINMFGIQTTGLAAATGGNRRDYSFVSSTVTRHTAPVLSGVAASSVSVNWSWTDTVPGVTSYTLYTASNGVITTLGGAATGWTETGLSGPNTQYTRLVRSVAADGTGDFSTASVYTLANPPAPVVVTSSGMHNLAIGWPADASSRYAIDRSPDGQAWTPLRSWADVYVSTWYNDTGLRYAATYYYAVSGYNHDGIISVSSTVTSGSDMTLPLAPEYAAVFSTAAAAQSVTRALPGLGQVTVLIPAGVADGYFSLSTSAAASPADLPKADLDAATAKLVNASLLAGSVMELRLFDVFGQKVTSALPSPARLTITYTDADDDGVVDGTAMGEAALRLFSLDTSELAWTPLRDSILDPAARTVYADLPHFSIYALGGFTSVAGPLAEVFAYPNPYRPGSGGAFDSTVFGEGIVFESLPARSKIKIYSLSGALVAELSDDDADGRCLWNARNKDGSRAASGVYLYVVSSSEGKKKGRVAIIR